jgi:hypothetical protein
MTTLFPSTNDEFKQFTSALNENLIEATNGQYRRKPAFLAIQIAHSLQNKPNGFNIHHLKAQLKSNEQEASLPLGGNKSTSSKTLFKEFNGNTLYRICKLGKALSKEKNISLDAAYTEVAMNLAIRNVEDTVKACRYPVNNKDVHILMFTNTLINVFIGRDKSINITSKKIPTKCLNQVDHKFSTGCVDYGEILCISKPGDFGTHKKYNKEIYHVCKYDKNQPRLPLPGLNHDEVLELSQLLSLSVTGVQYQDHHGHPWSNVEETLLFKHLQEWSLRNPLLAKKADGTYFENWGGIALSKPLHF